MRIPTDPDKKRAYVRFILDTCLLSKRDRKDLYDKRRRFFLYGTGADQEAVYNRMESHLDLVSSFLYSPDHAEYAISAGQNADKEAVDMCAAVANDFNDEMHDDGMFDAFGDALIWAIVFDSMFLKVGHAGEEVNARLVEPWKMGVWAEDETDFDAQQAIVHTYHIDYDNAVQRLLRNGLGKFIPRLNVVNTPFESPFPELITRMIITSTSGEALGGNVTGSVNPAYEAKPSYHARVDRPLVQFYELSVWDDECEDYRLFFVVDPDIIISDSKEVIDVLKRTGGFKPQREQMQQFYDTSCNQYLPKQHPFVQIRPYGIYDYFWGKAHSESLIPLQMWSNERLEQIHDILEKQAYPARVYSGFMGLSDEKAEAFGGADSWVFDQLPQATVKELAPTMPQDIFADYMQIGALFVEASGLTEVIQGKGASGVRSREHAKELKTTGAGRIKKTALRLEEPLVRMGDLALKLMMKNNPNEIRPDPKTDGTPGDPFLYANLVHPYTMRIAAHSHSPLFSDDSKDLAALLFKTQAIDQEDLIRMLAPPNKHHLIHRLRARQAMAALAKRLHPEGGAEKGPHPIRGRGRSAA